MINNDSRNDSLVGLISELSDVVSKRIGCKLPCVVISASDDRRRVSVRPLIRVVGVDGNSIQRDVIEGLTVFQYGAGDTLLSFPVSPGDIGWVEPADRDLGVFLQSYEESDPPSRRKHSFSDSVFVPDIMTNFTISPEDASAVVLQNRTGEISIALDQTQIRIVNGASRVEINDGTVIINGATITEDGNIITASGVSVDDHPHNQGPDSAGNTQTATDPPTATE